MMVAGAVKPCCCPLLSPKINAAMPVVTSSAPRTSTLPPPPDRFAAGSRGTSASMMAMTGGLIRNTARQPKYWVSSPPATIPAVAPAAVVACQIASARWRAAPSALVVVSSDSAAGETIAPAAPCTIRAMISMIGHCASPQASDAIPNRARPTASTCRRPSRSARRPPASSSDPNASAYPVTIHCNSAAGMPSSRWIDGSATFTMLKSSCSTNWAAQISEMTNTARREPPAAGRGAAPFVEWSAIGEYPVLTVFLTG